MNAPLPALRQDNIIMRLEAAKVALGDADVRTAKAIADVAAAAEIYAARQKLGEEVEQQAHSIKIDALRRLGELLRDAPKNKGQLLRGTEQEPRENAPTLAEMGIDKKTSAMAQKLAAMPERDFQAVRDGHEAVGKAIAKASKSRGAKSGPREPQKPPEDAEIERLKSALQESEEKREAAADEARDLQDKLDMLKATEPDEQQQLIAKLQKTIVRKDGEIQRLKGDVTHWQNKCNALIRQVKSLQKAK